MNLFEKHTMGTQGNRPASELDLDLDKKVWLKASDVTAEYAEQNIQDILQLMSFILAIFQKRTDGGRANLKQAKRMEQMCLLHPRLSNDAVRMLADPLDLSDK